MYTYEYFKVKEKQKQNFASFFKSLRLVLAYF